MDTSSPEFVAGRVVAVVVIERLIRARTAFVVWSVAAVALVLVIGTVINDGIGAIFVGLMALIASSVALTLFAVRAAVLRGLRRVGGGRDYARLRPIAEQRLDELRRAGTVIPLDPPSALRLAWLARRPAALQQQVREAATSVVRTIPEVVADVRRELAAGRNQR